jgi:hypothetical protein
VIVVFPWNGLTASDADWACAGVTSLWYPRMDWELIAPPHEVTHRDLTTGSAKEMTPLMGWIAEDEGLPEHMPFSNTTILLGDTVAGVLPEWKALMVLMGIWLDNNSLFAKYL